MKIVKLRLRLSVLAGGMALALSGVSQIASASTIVPPADKTPSATKATCKAGAKNYKDCKSQAFVSADAAKIDSKYMKENFNGTAPTTQTFKTAFDDWNSKQTSGVTWTLVDGGALADLTLTIDPFKAVALNNVGGISDITIKLTKGTAYKGPSFDQLVWSQGLYTNDSPTTPFGTNIDPPANTLDSYLFNKGGSAGGGAFTNPPVDLPKPPANSNDVTVNIGANPANKAWADPIYPFQSTDKQYFDGPQWGWPIGSFRAIALLSTVSMTTDGAGKVTSAKLTVYDGVSYGFDLSATAVPAPVPEPATWLMLLSGFFVLGSVLRRRAVRVRFVGLRAGGR